MFNVQIAGLTSMWNSCDRNVQYICRLTETKIRQKCKSYIIVIICSFRALFELSLKRWSISKKKTKKRTFPMFSVHSLIFHGKNKRVMFCNLYTSNTVKIVPNLKVARSLGRVNIWLLISQLEIIMFHSVTLWGWLWPLWSCQYWLLL